MLFDYQLDALTLRGLDVDLLIEGRALHIDAAQVVHARTGCASTVTLTWVPSRPERMASPCPACMDGDARWSVVDALADVVDWVTTSIETGRARLTGPDPRSSYGTQALSRAAKGVRVDLPRIQADANATLTPTHAAQVEHLRADLADRLGAAAQLLAAVWPPVGERTHVLCRVSSLASPGTRENLAQRLAVLGAITDVSPSGRWCVIRCTPPRDDPQWTASLTDTTLGDLGTDDPTITAHQWAVIDEVYRADRCVSATTALQTARTVTAP